jgi:hypothetical protein
MTTPKFPFRGPAESIEPYRVRVLLHRLWDDARYSPNLLPGSVEDLQRLLDAWEKVHPNRYCQMVADWAQKYLKSDNQHLVPFILFELPGWVEIERGPVYRANARLERSARDPLALPRPSNRIGRERYSRALDRHRETGDITIDGLRAWEHAEAWIKVRHGLTSLAAHVRSVGTRQYKKSDGELRLNNNNSYLWWWRNLKAVDAAIEAIVWPIPSSSN